MSKRVLVKALVTQLIFMPIYLSAQQNETILNFLPKPPEVSLIEQFGNLTINSASGLPNINIPLHSINYDGLSIPISISYLANGIMVNDISTSVGLKWMLNAGGSISRNIIGKPDENPGGWFSYDSNYVNAFTCDIEKLRYFYEGQKEATPDIFSYNVGDYSGGFFFSRDKEIIKSKGHDLCIHSIGEGLKFLIKDKLGNKFYFYDSLQTINNTETTIIDIKNQRTSYMDNGSGKTSWKVSKIVTPRGKTISFNYENYYYETPYYPNFYYFAKGIEGCMDMSVPPELQGLFKTEIEMGYTVALITLIETEHEKIIFNYSTDLSLSVMQRKLSSIIVINKFNNEPVKTITFQYDKYAGDPRLKLIGVDIIGDDDSINYSFRYDDQMLPVIGSTCQDAFGFINNNSVNHLIPVDQNHLLGFTLTPADREVSSTKITSGILTEIKYPTGGRTVFTYEPNSILSSGGTKVFYPGVRVREIRDINSDGIIYNQMNYVFSSAYSTNPHIENNYYAYFDSDIWSPDSDQMKYKLKRWSSSPRTNNDYSGFHYKKVETLILNNGKIIEEYETYKDIFTYQSMPKSKFIFDNENIALKKSIFSYYTDYEYFPVVEGLKTTSSFTLCGSYYCDGTYITSQESFGGIYPQIYKPLRYSIYQGLVHLPTQTIEMEYHGSDSIVIVESVSYKEYNQKFLVSGISKYQLFDTLSLHLEDIIYKYPFDYVGIQSMSGLLSNNIFGLPIDTRKVRNISGQELMLEGKVTDYISNGLPKQVHYWRSEYPGANIWLETQLLPDNSYQKELDVFYDNNFNIKESKSRGNITSSYVWAYNSQYPVIKAENTDYNSLSTAIAEVLPSEFIDLDNLLKVINGPDDPRLKTFNDSLRIHPLLNKGAITTYTYRPLLGVSSQTDPNGLTTYYEYDGLGRLIEVLDKDRNVLQEHKYNYANQ